MYELHLTVDHKDKDFNLFEWENACKYINAKPIWVKLSKGKHQNQIMLSVNVDNTKEAKDKQKILEKEMEFKIIRRKIESPLSSEEKAKYHEAHIKIPTQLPRKPVDFKTEHNPPIDIRLEGLASSWSIYSNKYIITSRLFDKPVYDAREVFFDYFRIVKRSFPEITMEMETVVEDTNPDLDYGWIDTPNTPNLICCGSKGYEYHYNKCATGLAESIKQCPVCGNGYWKNKDHTCKNNNYINM